MILRNIFKYNCKVYATLVLGKTSSSVDNISKKLKELMFNATAKLR